MLPFEPERKVPVMLGPNITGSFSARGMENNSVYTDGAFSNLGNYGVASGSSHTGVKIGFSANKSQSIFKDVTVQPPAFQTLIIIKA